MAIAFADFAGLLREEVERVSFESYSVEPSVIPRIFDVRPASEAPSGRLYWTESRAVRDSKLEKTEPGEDIKLGSAREGRLIPYRWKFFKHRIEVPDEFVRFGQVLEGNMISDSLADSIMDYVRPQARWFGNERARREEEYAADFFNQGGLTAGHEVFDQTFPGLYIDPKGDLCYDGLPLFALTGAPRSALDSTTYFNGIASSLTATNLKTLINRVEDSNAYDEMGRKISLMVDTVLVPKALRHTASEIIRAGALAGTANNDANSLADLEPVSWNFLTDTNAWFVLQANKGIRWYRGPDAPVVKVGDKLENMSTGIAVSAQWAANVDDWRYLGGSNFSTS
jgi:hypothetical protein